MIVVYILLAVVILLFMVLIHELGHYCVGRLLKFKIEEFSIGFGKAIFSRTNKRGEKISLRIFPLGGYCAFAGEDGTDAEGNPTDDKEAFTSQKPWKRILVFLAGVTFNFLTAIIFSFILLVSVGYDIYKVDKYVAIDNVVEYTVCKDYNPEVDGLRRGDVIFYVNGTKVDFAYSKTFQTLLDEAHESRRKWVADNTVDEVPPNFSQYPSLTFKVRREGKMQDIKVPMIEVKYLSFNADNQPIYKKDEQGNFILDGEGNKIQEIITAYTIGALTETENGGVVVSGINYSIYKHSFVEALARCVPFAFGLAWIVLKSLWALITFQVSISSVGGPITTIATIASVTQANMLNLLVLIPLISANLAVFNILPIPALDGAHVIFTLIEWIRGKPIKREVENMIHGIGLMVLFGLVILIDILHFVL